MTSPSSPFSVGSVMATVNHRHNTAAPMTGRLATLAARFAREEPHLPRGPFTRWPRATDALIVMLAFTLTLISVAVSELDDGDQLNAASIGDRPVGAFILLAVGAVALWWRRTRPIAVTAFELAVVIVWAIAGYGDGQDLILVAATYSVGRYSIDDRHSLATVAAAFSISVAGSIIDTSQRIDVFPAIIITVLPWYVGRRIRNRGDYLTLLQERAERLEAEQHAREREAVAAERTRIARELHDVVAHQVSMMTVQAGAAKTIARDDLDTAIDAMGDVERAGRRALGELRHLLGVLHRNAGERDHLGPQPGLAEVPLLADELRHTGAQVSLTLADVPDDLTTAHDLSGYRIVQESFTNIIKHAGPSPTVDVSIGFDDDSLIIDIANSTFAASPSLPGSGYGLAGMSERASLLGGTLTAGPEPPRRYRVTARLPLDTERS